LREEEKENELAKIVIKGHAFLLDRYKCFFLIFISPFLIYNYVLGIILPLIFNLVGIFCIIMNAFCLVQKARITKLSRPRFSKTLVLVKSKVLKI
jgi:hypothetical protein